MRLLLIMLLFTGTAFGQDSIPFSVRVVKIAGQYMPRVYVDQSRLTITDVNDTVLLDRPLYDSERIMLGRFMASINFDSLKNEYRTDAMDGAQIVFVMTYNNTNKQILLNNYYLKEMADLIDIINIFIIDEKLRIKYSYDNKWKQYRV